MKLMLCLVATGILAIVGLMYACIVVGSRMDDQMLDLNRQLERKGGDER